MSASRPDSLRRVAARNEDEEARPPRYRRLPSSDKLPEPLTERQKRVSKSRLSKARQEKKRRTRANLKPRQSARAPRTSQTQMIAHRRPRATNTRTISMLLLPTTAARTRIRARARARTTAMTTTRARRAMARPTIRTMSILTMTTRTMKKSIRQQCNNSKQPPLPLVGRRRQLTTKSLEEPSE